MAELFKAEKISYSYPKAADEANKPREQTEKALSDVSFEIEPGSFICILGKNGSGKSTLARHLNSLLCPTSGTLWVDGMNSADEEKLWQIRKLVGMVFQNPDNQIIGSVVEEDVAFGLENLGVPSEKIREEVHNALSGVDMDSYSKFSPNKLSGGQKQRVAVAGILAMKPKCIVLDEATAMLDPKGRGEVISLISRLNSEQGITVILITHYMDEAMKADKIYVMDSGKILMEGTPREIFSRPEKIEQAGLRLPQITQLAEELRKAGLPIPKDAVFISELAPVIKNILERAS